MFMPQNVSFLFLFEPGMYIDLNDTFQRQVLLLNHIICKTEPLYRQVSWPISVKWQCDANDLQSNTEVLSNHKIKYLETGIKLTSIKRFIRLHDFRNMLLSHSPKYIFLLVILQILSNYTFRAHLPR